MHPSFIHLHVHSEYSLLDGLSKVSDLVKKASELGMKSLGLTDHGVMYGAVKFYVAAREMGIKPIIGVEAYLANRTRFDRDVAQDKELHHQLLLAKNGQGYRNLMKLTTLAQLEGFYYKPRIDRELMEKFHQGLIATSGCLQGEIPQLILKNQLEEAKKSLRWYISTFGEDFYLELQRHVNIPELTQVNQELLKLSREFGVPVVATNDVHYISPDDAEAQDALLAVGTKKLLSDKNRLTMIGSPDFYLKSEPEMNQLFQDIPEAVANTQKIADKSDIDIQIGKWILPHYPIEDNETPESTLRKLALGGLEIRFKDMSAEIKRRADYELDVICRKGFATYFLIVQDFVNWAKRQEIRVGPGRGSVAGSIVAYALRITSINPLEHNIPFERFMNPDRPTPPDIDMDFADDRRDEVIGYITEKYGPEKVAQIITFGTMEARQAIRDIGRVMGISYSVCDRLAKAIPLKSSFQDAVVTSLDLQEAGRDPAISHLFRIVEKVEGVTRHASTHAAGVVMADKELTEYTPLQRESGSDRIMTQYDMYSLDLNVSDKAIGLLKIDLLGLRNLTILGKAVELVKQNEGLEIDLSEIPLDKPEVYQMLEKGETTGVFQLESQGMRRLARHLKPNKFSDITAMVALFRPGPMELINDFVEGKRHPEKIKYLHPDLKPILAPTYGVAVYQEQCMQIANRVAGYTMAEADNLRRAIGKKEKSIMTKEKKKFISGALKKDYSQSIAEKIWGFIEKFVGYGFNIPHSVSYAMIAYQTAYMKVSFSVEYMTAMLTAESKSSSGPVRDQKMALGISECKRLGIVILPPDINRSCQDFSIESNQKSLNGKAIRFGLSAIKNVGVAAISEIISQRENGEFKSIYDFLSRADSQKINRRVVESLIKVGALDGFGKKTALLSVINDVRAKISAKQRQTDNGQASLFEDSSGSHPDSDLELPDLPEFPADDLLIFQKELLGIFLSEHPFLKLMGPVKHLLTGPISDLSIEESVGKSVTLAGVISHHRVVQTRRTSQMMCFATLEDESSNIELVVFPKIYETSGQLFIKDSAVLVSGRIDAREDKLHLVVDKALDLKTDISSLSGFNPSVYTIHILRETSKVTLSNLAQLLKSHSGSDQVKIVMPYGNGSVKTMDLPYKVNRKAVEQEVIRLLKS